MYIALILVFATIGALGWELPGLLLGGALGWLIAHLWISRNPPRDRAPADTGVAALVDRVESLERQVAVLRDRLGRIVAASDNAMEHTVEVRDATIHRPEAPIMELATEAVQAEPVQPAIEKKLARDEETDFWTAPQPTSVTAPKMVRRMLDFFSGGNPVVRVGVVVLFFGVAFLVRYAAEHALLPIEFRLSGIALAAIAALIVGWRLRERPGHYGLVLQGGAIGVLYLTVYGAAKLYSLLPLGFALGLMVALVLLTGALSILQNARWLALFGSAGGFLAPVLVSTGGGSHVALFSYYALLNAGVVGIAWFRSWRELNLLGFAFTFVIASAWGYQYYRPEHFSTTEPFLVLFFVFYVIVAVLFAIRQPPELRGYVDGTLVFGVPLVAFALQNALVRDMPYGLAISALVAAAFYILLARFLWRREAQGLRLLVEVFLALGVVFASLAIPLALDGRWTAAAWALEGAALIWVGVRQQRFVARAFGLLLHVGAGGAFLLAINAATGAMPMWNGIWLGSFMIAVAGLFSAWYLQRHQTEVKPWEAGVPLPLMIWGMLWWLGAGLNEIDTHLGTTDQPHAIVTLLAVTALAFSQLGARLTWRAMAVAAAGLLPLLWLTLAVEFGSFRISHAFERWGLVAWMLAMVTHLLVLRRGEQNWPELLIRCWHPVGLWLLVAVATWELDWVIRETVLNTPGWRAIAWAVIPGVTVLALQRWGARMRWPVGRYSDEYLGTGLGLLVAYLWLWALAITLEPGGTRPLPYVPLLNPVDLAQCFALLTVLQWVLWRRTAATGYLVLFPPPQLLFGAVAAGGFVWLNAMVARGVHFLDHVPWSTMALSRSVVFQTSVSILWTLVAFGIMVLASRKTLREIWFIGAVLLAVVVMKLFLVDLSSIGTVARIVSFMAVGGLMLVIGYFSPLPPRPSQREVSA